VSINDNLFNEALEAITKLFSDKTVSQKTCKDNLIALISEIDMLLDSLPHEDENDD